MDDLIFTKIQSYTLYKCKHSRWQLSKEHNFHIGSGPLDYYAQWFYESDNKWKLYIGPYEGNSNWSREKTLIETVDTIFDVFEYIQNNKHPKYNQ